MHPENNYKTERTVIFTDDDSIELSVINLNSKSGKKRLLKFNKEWNLIATRNSDNSGFDYSPPLKYFEFPLSPGKTWQQASTETNIKTGIIRKHKILGAVGEWEDITVPAGTFHTIKISLNTGVFNPDTGEKITGTDISWYAPDAKRSVKSEITSHNETNNTEQHSVTQLISFNRDKTKSANEGDNSSSTSSSSSYNPYREVPESIKLELAAKFKQTKQAAEHGNIDAQLELGDMYRYGLGVPEDNSKAIELFKKVAAQDGDNAVQARIRLKGMATAVNVKAQVILLIFRGSRGQLCRISVANNTPAI